METLVTSENIEEIKADMSANDQRDEIAIGCETWGVLFRGARGQMTRWPNGRGAVAFGSTSIWGTWCNGVLVADDGTVFDEYGAHD